MDEFTAAFHAGIDERLPECHALVSSLGCDRIFLMGGMVYRSIIASLYGTRRPDVDFDFIVDQLPSRIDVPGWNVIMNRYNHPKLSKGELVVDIAPFHSMTSIVRRNLLPNAENYLTGTPLNIQSILYSFNDDIIIGDIGKQALLEKAVKVNDREEAGLAAMKKGLTLRQMIEQKAKSTGFTPVIH
jgi:hypothetical protein